MAVADSGTNDLDIRRPHHPQLLAHWNQGIVTSDMNNHGGILTPQALMDSWQDSIQELFTHADNQGTSLDATIKVYDDFFATSTPSPSRTPGASSTAAKKKYCPSAVITNHKKA